MFFGILAGEHVSDVTLYCMCHMVRNMVLEVCQSVSHLPGLSCCKAVLCAVSSLLSHDWSTILASQSWAMCSEVAARQHLTSFWSDTSFHFWSVLSYSSTCLHTQTHTHTPPFNSPLSGTTWVSRYQKGKTNLDFTEARDSEWQRHQLGHMQICTLL